MHKKRAIGRKGFSESQIKQMWSWKMFTTFTLMIFFMIFQVLWYVHFGSDGNDSSPLLLGMFLYVVGSMMMIYVVITFEKFPKNTGFIAILLLNIEGIQWLYYIATSASAVGVLVFATIMPPQTTVEGLFKAVVLLLVWPSHFLLMYSFTAFHHAAYETEHENHAD